MQNWFKKIIILFLILNLYIILPAQEPVLNTQSNVQFITRSLNEKNINYELRPHLSAFGSFGSSVHVFIPSVSSDYNGGIFVLAIPLDSFFAVESSLAFIDALKAQTSSDIKHDIMITFLANETSLLGDPLYSSVGLKDLVSQTYMPENWVVCYLDIDEAPQTLKITHGAINYITPLEITRSLPSILNNLQIPFIFESRYNELYKMGLVKSCEKLTILSQDEIHCIKISSDQSSRFLEQDYKITTELMAHMLLDYNMGLELPLEDPYQNYFIFSFFNNIFFISEFAALFFLILLSASMLIIMLYLSATRRVALISRIRLFFRRGWVFIILLPGMILIFKGTGLFYGFIHQMLGKSIPQTNLLDSILIISLAIWLLYLFFHLLSFLNFPRKAQFYGISAIIITCIGILASAIIEFTFIAIFLWALLFAILGAVSKKPFLIILCGLLIPLRALGAFINIHETSGMLLELFVIPGDVRSWLTSFQIAVLCLPVMLLVKRGMIINKTTLKDIFKITPFVLRIIVLVILFSAIMLRLTIFYNEPEKPTEITVIHNDNDDLRFTFSERIFQESLIINARLESNIQPLLFNLYLESADEEAPLVYYSPVPMERLNSNTIRFILGEHPPNPLNLEIVLRNGHRGIFFMEALILKDNLGN